MIDSTHMVHVIDDDEAIRAALELFLNAEGLSVNTYSSANEFIANVTDETDGVLVSDIRMPGMSGLELQQYLIDNNVKLPVIFITGHGDVAMAVSAMHNGAVNFIEKPFDNALLLESIYNSFRIQDERKYYKKNYESIKVRFDHLTKREKQVMKLLVEGDTNKQIANFLNISVRTVEIHRMNVIKKMEVKSLAELVRLSMEMEYFNSASA